MSDAGGAEVGVVLGSESMKKAKISSEPLRRWWRGTGQGSPSQAARPNVIPT